MKRTIFSVFLGISLPLAMVLTGCGDSGSQPSQSSPGYGTEMEDQSGGTQNPTPQPGETTGSQNQDQDQDQNQGSQDQGSGSGSY